MELFNEQGIHPEYLKKLREYDADALRIRAYFLPGARTKESVQCRQTGCVCRSKSPMSLNPETTLFETEPMLFCYLCNKTVHVRCLGLDLSSLKQQPTPFRCTICLKSPINTASKAFYDKDKYKSKVAERRRAFLKDLSGEAAGYGTDDEYDKADLDAFLLSEATLPTLSKHTGTLPKPKPSAEEQKKRDEEAQELKRSEDARKRRQQEELRAAELEKEKRKINSDNQKVQSSEVEQRKLEEARKEAERERIRADKWENAAKEYEKQNQLRFEAMQRQIEDLSSKLAGASISSQSDSSHVHKKDPPLNASTLASDFYASAAQAPSSEKIDWDVRFNDSPREERRTPAHNVTAKSDINETMLDVITRMAEEQRLDRQEKNLRERRKATPKITEFDGDPLKWLDFKDEVESYRLDCEYDDKTIKNYVKKALKGDAFDYVKDVFRVYSLSQIMDMLKEGFGDAMVLIGLKARELKELKLPSTLRREDLMKAKIVIQGYFTACANAGTGCLNSSELGTHLYELFSDADQRGIRNKFTREHPGEEVVISLKCIYDYMVELQPQLASRGRREKDKGSEKREEKKPAKPFQLHATSTSTNATSANAEIFQIKDKNAFPAVGYDMAKLDSIAKRCEICGKDGHYSVQCFRLRDMNETQRMQVTIDKKLCRNCLVTADHGAFRCELKVGCGAATSQGRICNKKHHAGIHNISLQKAAAYHRNAGRGGGANNGRGNVQQGAGQAQGNNALQPAAAFFHSVPPDGRQYSITPRMNNMLQCSVNRSVFQNTVKTFKTIFYGPKGSTICFAVGDSAAELSIVRNDLRIALGIEGVSEVISMTWSDGTIKQCAAVRFDLVVQGVLKHNKKLVLKDCYAVDDLDLPPRTMDMEVMRKEFPYLKDVNFDGYRDEQPVMIIGTTHAFACENMRRLVSCENGGPIAIEAELGVSVFGGRPPQYPDTPRSVHVVSACKVDKHETKEDEPDVEEEENKVSNEELHRLLVMQNSIESLGIKPKQTQQTENEKKAIAILTEEMRQLEDGRVEAPLIWNRIDGEIPEIENNYHLALKRQLAHEAKLRRNPGHREMFNNCIADLMRLGYVRKAEEKDFDPRFSNVWYMPMSLVINPNKSPPKPRIVYDVSARYHNVSLNDLLLKGPDLLIELVKPILKMRTCRIAMTADVQQMFHRVAINQRDQQCQRLLWREDEKQQMQTLILGVMAFGPTCSPFVSQFVKNWNADRFASKFPLAAKVLKELVYMDDCLLSLPSAKEAAVIANQLIEICKAINWNLTSFQSNSLELLKSLPHDNVKKEIIPMMSELNEGYVTKVLGCNWNTTLDCYVYEINKNIFVQLVRDFNQSPTKRDQASTIPRIFDVLGFISPFIIRGRILLQRSWRAKVDWDDPIPEDIRRDWTKWLNEVENIEKLRIPRMYADIDSLAFAEEVQLHIFCDAGIEAYGCVAYFVVKHRQRTECGIVMAKAKVTPLRIKTETEMKEIPRLELLSALIAARLGETITTNHHDLPLKRYFWSDSEVVLRWIKNENVRLLKFAIGPVEEILEVTNRDEWRYVPTSLNPADYCTKFKKMDFSDSSSTWFTGPEFLREPEENWPQVPEKLLSKESSIAIINNIYMQKLKYSTHKLPPIDCAIANDSAISRLSAATQASWTKLTRAVARALKLHMDGLIPLVKSKDFNDSLLRAEMRDYYKGFRQLKASDLGRAKHFIMRKIQRESFPEEYELLRQGKRVTNRDFAQLNVFMDKEGLLRINSRVNLNSVTYPQQFAPVLPRKHDFVHVLLMHVHEKHKHISVEAQIADVRTECWILQVRAALQEVRTSCNECNVRKAKPYDPEMAPLPEYRTNPSLNPFEVTSVDALGPITVFVYGRPKKVWILIFVCTLTRFVHMHILESLESLRVLEAIVVFWAAHGPVSKFVSDNGTNFVGAANLLKQDYEDTKLFLQQQSSVLAPKLSEKFNVDWEFLPPGSPWMGGCHERMVKEAKRAIFETLNQRKIHKIELNIAIHEAAHRINLRPLTHNSISAEDDALLTPHDLAKHRAGWNLLPGLHKGKYAQSDDKSIYRRGRQVADEIMRKFVSHYLPVLTKRCKWFHDKSPIKVNDLVLLINPNETRTEWKRGRVIKVKKGRDGKGRVADVMLANGVIKYGRSARNLAKLEISP